MKSGKGQREGGAKREGESVLKRGREWKGDRGIGDEGGRGQRSRR